MYRAALDLRNPARLCRRYGHLGARVGQWPSPQSPSRARHSDRPFTSMSGRPSRGGPRQPERSATGQRPLIAGRVVSTRLPYQHSVGPLICRVSQGGRFRERRSRAASAPDVRRLRGVAAAVLCRPGGLGSRPHRQPLCIHRLVHPDGVGAHASSDGGEHLVAGALTTVAYIGAYGAMLVHLCVSFALVAADLARLDACLRGCSDHVFVVSGLAREYARGCLAHIGAVEVQPWGLDP